MAGEYLSEMPGVLDAAVETIEGLPQAMCISPSSFSREESREDVLYLIGQSEKLSAEVKCAKETVYLHFKYRRFVTDSGIQLVNIIAVRQTEQAKTLTILASIFIPVSFLAVSSQSVAEFSMPGLMQVDRAFSA
jgi:hypothetical protein